MFSQSSSFKPAQTLQASIDSTPFPVASTPLTTASASGAPALFRSSSLLFIDPTVGDYQSLVAGAAPGTEVHVLSPIQDAITQITNTLLGREGIESIHIVSHGENGSLGFADSMLNLADLPQYAAQVQSWSNALSDDADILLYGCNVAEGELGKAFVQILSNLTGADVAASDDLTGNSALGGDWNLEFKTGLIEATQPFSLESLSAFQNVLATFTVNNINVSSTGSKDSGRQSW